MVAKKNEMGNGMKKELPVKKEDGVSDSLIFGESFIVDFGLMVSNLLAFPLYLYTMYMNTSDPVEFMSIFWTFLAISLLSIAYVLSHWVYVTHKKSISKSTDFWK